MYKSFLHNQIVSVSNNFLSDLISSYKNGYGAVFY